MGWTKEDGTRCGSVTVRAPDTCPGTGRVSAPGDASDDHPELGIRTRIDRRTRHDDGDALPSRYLRMKTCNSRIS